MSAAEAENEAAAGDMLAAAFSRAARVYSELSWALVRAEGKRPVGREWQKAAPMEPGAAAGAWSRWGEAFNMGVVLGPSGVLVVEYDDPDAEPRLLGLFGGALPLTPVCRTGSGKLHVYFADPGGTEKVARDGLELRAGAHHCLVPPSVHPDTGQPYAWVDGHHPAVTAVAATPDAVLEFFQGRNGSRPARKKKVPAKIGLHNRHDELFRIACSARGKGHSEAEIRALLVATNAGRCDPPLPAGEVRELARDVAGRYEPNATGIAREEDLPPVEGDVDGAALLNDLVAHICRFMVLTHAQAAVIALFALMTHCVDAFQVVPYLRVFSPTKRTGKSRLLELLEFLVHRPVKTGGISEAALFRALAEGVVTLLFDEVGKVLGESARDRNSDIEAVLLNGYAAGTPVLRCVGEGTRQTVTPFPVFGPKVLGGTGKLDEMITDRCLPIALKRKSRTEPVERFRRRDANAIAEPLRARMAAWAASHIDELACARPELPDVLDDRAQDIAEPLLAVADLAGEEWPRLARRAVIELRGDGAFADEDEIGVELLADIRRAFESDKVDRLSTERLLLLLCADKERPWATWHRGDPISTRALANLLRDFGIRSNTLRLPDETRAKGYARAQFDDAWARYLPLNPPSIRDNVTTRMVEPKTPDSYPCQDADVTDAKTGVNPHGYWDVTDVTDRPPIKGGGRAARHARRCDHSAVWLARDGKWRCSGCEPPAFPGEVVEESQA